MRIAVFCASSGQINEIYFRAAYHLGEYIAVSGWELVYGGTNVGLMKTVAQACLKKGGKVTGIIPECIVQRGVAAEGLDRLLVAPDMKERKFLLRENSDAFVALPGGWGTLEEITEVMTLKQLGEHHKPVVFLNTAGFYEPFLNFLNSIEKEGFVSPVYRQLYQIVDQPEEVIDYIRSYQKNEEIMKY